MSVLTNSRHWMRRAYDGLDAPDGISAKNLEALGAERLAELLIEISTGNAAVPEPRMVSPPC